MSSNAVLPDKYSLPKVIGAKTHGLIDYGHAVFFFGMALVCRKKNPRAAVAALATGSFILIQSLLTEYPLGAEPLIEFNLHGKMDAGMAATSFIMPELCGFSGTGAATVFRANSVVESTVLALTNWSTEKAQIQRLIS
jgi:hypothetical protein